MFYCRMLVDKSMPYEEHPCRHLIPIDPDRKGVNTQIVKCTSMATGEGYSMMRIITEGDIDVPEGRTAFKDGECTIERISSNHYTAMITNRTCFVCSLFSENRCFLMSSVPVDERHVEWTVVGQDSETVHSLTRRMKELGYRVKFLASGKFGDSMTLTPKEEAYIKTAYDCGYYNVPRKIDLNGICDMLGCSKSTLNVTLRTAERKLICYYLDGSGGKSNR